MAQPPPSGRNELKVVCSTRFDPTTTCTTGLERPERASRSFVVHSFLLGVKFSICTFCKNEMNVDRESLTVLHAPSQIVVVVVVAVAIIHSFFPIKLRGEEGCTRYERKEGWRIGPFDSAACGVEAHAGVNGVMRDKRVSVSAIDRHR